MGWWRTFGEPGPNGQAYCSGLASLSLTCSAVIAPVHKHFLRDDDNIWSKPQRSLDLADENGFTVVNACFGD